MGTQVCALSVCGYRRALLAALLAALAALAALPPPARADTVAYVVDSGTVGNQAFGGSLGMDFQTNRPMTVTHLGVFDSQQNGVSGTLTAWLYARGPGNTGVPVGQLTFTGGQGQLIGGSRFQELATPLELPGGFAGTIVAEGYGASEPNGNSGTPTQWHTYGGPELSFVGSSRWGNAGQFPPNADGGPANRYAAGTFIFDASGPVLPTGSIGTIPVANGSFEQPARPQQPAGGYYGPADGWTHIGSFDGGNFHPAASVFTDPIPDGNQVAYVNGGSLISAPLPGPGLEKDTLYILDVDWGHRGDTDTPYHSMNLRAGGVELGWLNDSNMRKGAPVGPGQFEANRLYATANHNAAIGSALDIKLDAGNSFQAVYDNVRVTKITGAAVLLNNPSFELDNVATGGWQLGAVGWAHTANPNCGVVEMPAQITPADGAQCAFVAHGGSLTQTLTGVPLMAGYRYILLAEVADRSDTPFAGYGLELLAGGQVVAADYDTLDVLETDSRFYVTAVVDFTVDSSDYPLIGQDLGIRLTAPTSDGHAYFDNIRLFAVAVPEPGTMALIGLGVAGLGGYLRRRRHAAEGRS